MTNRCVWTLSMIHDGQDEMRACSHAVPQVHLLVNLTLSGHKWPQQGQINTAGGIHSCNPFIKVYI